MLAAQDDVTILRNFNWQMFFNMHLNRLYKHISCCRCCCCCSAPSNVEPEKLYDKNYARIHYNHFGPNLFTFFSAHLSFSLIHFPSSWSYLSYPSASSANSLRVNCSPLFFFSAFIHRVLTHSLSEIYFLCEKWSECVRTTKCTVYIVWNIHIALTDERATTTTSTAAATKKNNNTKQIIRRDKREKNSQKHLILKVSSAFSSFEHVWEALECRIKFDAFKR